MSATLDVAVAVPVPKNTALQGQYFAASSLLRRNPLTIRKFALLLFPFSFQCGFMSKIHPLRQAVAVSPDNLPLLLLLAHACLDEWSLDEARSVFERALQIDPARPEPKLGIARILHLSGKTSEAVVRTESVLAQHPDFAPAHLLLARLNAGEGNRDTARQCYERALALDPTIRDAALEKELKGRGPQSHNRRRPRHPRRSPRRAAITRQKSNPEKPAIDSNT